MRVLPERVNREWIDSLSDVDLLDVEARVREQFSVLERREKRERGDKYQLMRGSAELMLAWDRWSRILTVTRERELVPLKEPAVTS